MSLTCRKLPGTNIIFAIILSLKLSGNQLKKAILLEFFVLIILFDTYLNYLTQAASLQTHEAISKAIVLLITFTSIVFSIGPLVIATLASAAVKNRWVLYFFAFLATTYHLFNTFLQFYFLNRRFSFDLSLFFLNKDIALKTVWLAYSNQLSVFLIFIALHILYFVEAVVFISYFRRKLVSTKDKSTALIITLMITCVGVFIINYKKSEMYTVVSPIAGSDNEAKKIYIKNHALQLKKLDSLVPVSSGQTANENIIVLQLESLNSDLLDQKTTPNLTKIANDGVYMPKMQSSSVNSLRALESILCGLIPSLSLDISKLGVNLYDLNCLPKILSKNDYKTFYFMSADVLNDTKPFVTKVGFDETHFEDIMKPNDKKLNWGYRDDIFLQRVFEYLEKYKGEKLFVFIDLSSNHFPFWDLSKQELPEFNSKIPYLNPKTFKEKLQNTTFIQDTFIGEFYEKYKKEYANNTALIVFGDHSWPYGIHNNNNYNENNIWQENLVTPFIYIPVKTKVRQYAVGGKINKIYSQYDVPSTILDTLEIFDSFNKQSFFNELIKPSETNINNACIISTQPYSGGYISLLKYPEKYIFNLRKQVVDTYDLNKDPNELSPKENNITQNYLNILEGCLRENIQTK